MVKEMEFNLSSAQGQTLNLIQEIPAELEQYRLPYAAYASISGSFGAALFQTIPNYGFDVRYNNYAFKEAFTLRYQSEAPSLELQVMLKNGLQSDVEGFSGFVLKQHQFNMTYLPFVRCTSFFNAGDYSNFEIHYARSYLEEYALMLPELEAFLSKIDKGIPTHLLPKHAFATPEMFSVIRQILESGYHSDLQKIYLDIKGSELLFLAMKRVSPSTNGHPVRQADLEKMHAAKLWMEEHVDCPGGLVEIAKAAGTSESKLKKEFKEVFGNTVFEFLLKLRMKKALQLLKETDKTVSEIAYLTGYSSHPSFTNAFTRHFGFSPLYVRKK
jgi:AraC family transcriptional regulator, transcriptional activator of the genes for pyochelin and ferripyochelin receptors